MLSRAKDHKAYWPKEENTFMELDLGIKLTTTECTNHQDYIYRYIIRFFYHTFLISLTFRVIQVEMKGEDNVYSVEQIQLTKWSETNTLNVRRVARDLRMFSVGPLLVHCRDGGTKSGLFIAAFKMLQDCYDPNVTDLDTYKTVLDMTKAGLRVLENKKQYRFIYQCLYDELTETDYYGNDYPYY